PPRDVGRLVIGSLERVGRALRGELGNAEDEESELIQVREWLASSLPSGAKPAMVGATPTMPADDEGSSQPTPRFAPGPSPTPPTPPTPTPPTPTPPIPSSVSSQAGLSASGGGGAGAGAIVSSGAIQQIGPAPRSSQAGAAGAAAA